MSVVYNWVRYNWAGHMSISDYAFEVAKRCTSQIRFDNEIFKSQYLIALDRSECCAQLG